MMMGMSDTFLRSTQNETLAKEMKVFANDFFNKFKADLIKDQKEL